MQLNKEDIYRNVTSICTLHVVTNRNVEILCKFTVENNLIVIIKQFQHKHIDYGTRLSPYQRITIHIELKKLPHRRSKSSERS